MQNLSATMRSTLNFFDLLEHVHGKDPSPEVRAFSAGDLILPCGDPVDALYVLQDGIVVAKTIDPLHGNHREAFRFIGVPKVCAPVFGADAYAYSRPTSYVYEAETGGEVVVMNSAFVNRVCKARGVLNLAREILRSSELAEILRPKLGHALEETGLKGFDPDAPDRLFQAGTNEEEAAYIRFSRDLMAEITTWRRIRSAYPSTKMKALPREAVPTHIEDDGDDRRTTAIEPLERRTT